ncbi:unnamed protein product [Calicophoron daubneyi]
MSASSTQDQANEFRTDKLPKCTLRNLGHLCRLFVSEMIGLGLICFVCVIYQPPSTGLNLPFPVVLGLVFTWVLWVCGPISGAQVNPCVSLALLFTRRLSVVHAIVCMAGQLVGATAGAWIAIVCGPESLSSTPYVGMTMRSTSISVGQAIGLEIIGTMILVISVLSVSDEFRASAWSQGHFTVFPFEFGVTLALIAATVGMYSGGSVNPFRSLGPAFVNRTLVEQWIYIVGPLIGCVLATVVYELMLSNGASGPRIKAWFTDSEFDRRKDYRKPHEKRYSEDL